MPHAADRQSRTSLYRKFGAPTCSVLEAMANGLLRASLNMVGLGRAVNGIGSFPKLSLATSRASPQQRAAIPAHQLAAPGNISRDNLLKGLAIIQERPASYEEIKRLAK